MTSYKKNWNFNFIKKSRLMRLFKYKLKNKSPSRSSGIVLTSTSCFLLGGLWVLGGLFYHPIVDLILSTTTSTNIVSSVVKTPIVFSESNTVINLFKWKGDRFQSGHLYWQNFVTKRDLVFAFQAYIPYLNLVPTNTRLSVLEFMHNPNNGNLLLLQEFSTRGIVESHRFSIDNLHIYFWRGLWPAYSRMYPKSLQTFIMVWRELIVKI